MESCPRMVERSEGPASVLAIGTSVPPNVMYQKDYPDFYFRVTNSNHQIDLKQKFERMCEKSCITKRHLFLTEELLKANPSLCAYWERSLDVRQDMVVVEVPKLAAAAATAAMEEWGQPRSRITHLIFCTTAGVDMPGADWALMKLLGLRGSVQRLMLYQQGCYGGGTVLRVAKDLAENNRGARVLVVCSEITAMTFRGPSDTHLDSLVGQALFGDGAAALVVGCRPEAVAGERACFEIHRAACHVLPDSDGAIDGHLREVGLTFHLLKDVPSIIAKNIASLVQDLLDLDFDHHQDLDPLDYNDMFWIVHPGGPAILDQVQDKLHLHKHKLASSRHVLDQFGNMSSACVHFIMDHMRRSSSARRLPTSGDGHRWGLLLAFGPGLTCEALLLRALPPLES